jgi:hypothetical protein
MVAPILHGPADENAQTRIGGEGQETPFVIAGKPRQLIPEKGAVGPIEYSSGMNDCVQVLLDIQGETLLAGGKRRYGRYANNGLCRIQGPP